LSWEAIFSSRTIETILSYGTTLLAAAVILRLWREGLVRTYRAFTALMVFDVVSTLFLLTLTYRTTSYSIIWMTCESTKLLLYAAVTLELFDVGLRPYPGIARAGQQIVRVSLVVATVLTLLTLQLDLSRIPAWHQKALPYFFAVQRTFILTLAVFQILVFAFLSWFQVRLSYNARVYATILVAFFSFKSLGILSLIIQGRERTRTVSMCVMAVLCACEAAWAFLLKRTGEDTRSSATLTGRRTAPIALTARLEALNLRLSDSTKPDKKDRS